MMRPDSTKVRGERRGGDRAKIRKVGRIVSDDPRKIVSCIILDLSPTGALLLVHHKVPDQFALFHAAARTLRPVTVIRRRAETIGVRFDGEGEVLRADDLRLYDLKA